MAIVVSLRCVEDLPGKADRYARLSFRGSEQHSKTVRAAKKAIYFGERFEWPIARPLEPTEALTVEVHNLSKFITKKRPRLVGSLSIVLQQLLQNGELQLCERLTDANHRTMEAKISVDIRYYSPDGQVGSWDQGEFDFPLFDSQTLDEVGVRESEYSTIDPTVEREIQARLLAHQRQNNETKASSESSEDNFSIISGGEIFASFAPTQGGLRNDVLEGEVHRLKDFQVCVTILEAQQLTGLDIDPVVKVEVGDNVKYTAIKTSTNCPYYDEYFVFDFTESPAVLYDKILTLTVYNAMPIPGRSLFKAGNLLAGRVIGMFRCDVGTIFSAPGHMFYRKWAVLLNPKDILEGPQGFLKCELSVTSKGNVPRPPKTSLQDENNVEGNLLLPSGVPLDRERASYRINIYCAEDLPRMDTGILANIAQAFRWGKSDLIDAYAKVSFVGHTGKTSVKKSCNPEWKQVLTFVDMFPPLCNRIKIEVCDSDTLSDDVIATHFIELKQIMDPGGETEGILPTFGPCWINLYGAPRNPKENLDKLNEGVGEGSAYRGRMLVSVKTEILEKDMGGPSTVYVNTMRTAGRLEVAVKRQFLLFTTLYDAVMINKEYKDKEIYFEISIGTYGNTLDAKGAKGIIESSSDEEDDEDENVAEERSRLLKKAAEEEAEVLPANSTTSPKVPVTNDKTYYYIPLEEEKPCLYVCSKFEDFRKRLYHSNILSKAAEAMDEAVEEIRLALVKVNEHFAHKKLKTCMDNIQQALNLYLKVHPVLGIGAGSGKTNLDKYRLNSCKTYVTKMKNAARAIRTSVTDANIKEKFREAREILRKLKHIAKEPQPSLPDVFIWMIADKERIAYHRMPAKALMWATQPECMGKHCGQVQDIFLKRPGRKSAGEGGWAVQAHLTMYTWLGQWNDKKGVAEYLTKLPAGYEETEEIQNAANLPPSSIIYPEESHFQMRAYISQARSLIGSDASGLSDPFARVIVQNSSQETHVEKETLNPRWDEGLMFDDVIYSIPSATVKARPPIMIVEVFDYDLVGSPDFLGRSIVRPKVKLEDDAYDEPEFPAPLKWWDIYRGAKKAGEILAAFELLQVGEEIAEFPTRKLKNKTIFTIPPSIMSNVNKYRMEVMFWGVRGLKRLQLMTVDSARVEIDIAGHVVKSPQIPSLKTNSNFDNPIQTTEIELPENVHFWPPLTIRCFAIWGFGREVLVGSCTINDISKYVWVSPEEKERLAQEKKRRQEEKEEEKRKKKKEAKENDLFYDMMDLANGFRPVSALSDTSKKGTKKPFFSSLSKLTTSRDKLNTTIISEVPEVSVYDGDTRSLSIRSLSFADDISVSAVSRKSKASTRLKSILRGKREPSIQEVLPETDYDQRSINGRSVDGLDNLSLSTQSVDSKVSRALSYYDENMRNTPPTPLSKISEGGEPTDNQANKKDVVIVIEESGPPVPTATPQAGSPPTGTPNPPPDGTPQEAIALSAFKEKLGQKTETPETKKKKKDLIADLDWWSKYHISKSDKIKEKKQTATQPQQESGEKLVKKEQGKTPATDGNGKDTEASKTSPGTETEGAQTEHTECDSSSDDDDTDSDILSGEGADNAFSGMDFEGLDKEKMKNLKDLKSDSDEEGDRMKRKLRKKAKRSKKKKMKKRAKKAKKHLAKLKDGISNLALKHDEDDEETEEIGIPDDSEDKSYITRIKIYNSELEKVAGFGGFEDWVETFPLARGKTLEDEEDDGNRVVGKFKGKFCLYKLEETTEDNSLNTNNIVAEIGQALIEKGENLRAKVESTFKENISDETDLPNLFGAKEDTKKSTTETALKLVNFLPSTKPFEVLLRIYIIRAIDLHPMDLNGKADPYLLLRCGKKEINDKKHRQPNQLNPVFGRMYELTAVFPLDSLLHIDVYDYDASSADDIIGSTTIDLENRFFTKHQATCGLSKQYEIYGYNTWRDPRPPTAILNQLCNDFRVLPPVFSTTTVTCGGIVFTAPTMLDDEHGDGKPTLEHLALEVLKHWHMIPGGCVLVPEHVETRPIFSVERPGIEQGRIEMWIDMFPKDKPIPSYHVDITPRKPTSWEMRVIIYNTSDVVMEDTNLLTGESSSDIFVLGYLIGVGTDDQSTDIHYRSMDGDGNFNWRFKYRFNYHKAEEKIVHREQVSIFDNNETEVKLPAKLTLQVWDADLISSDDFLGGLVLDLNRIPRPAKDKRNCTLRLLRTDGSVPTLNLFKQRRCRGWWPFEATADPDQDEDSDEEDIKDQDKPGFVLKGKVEAEIHLLTTEEAEKTPAGLARENPEALPQPNRPDSSFLWFANPLKTLKYIIWKNYKWTIIKGFLIALLIAFIALAIYAAPGVIVKKMFGA